MAQATTEPRTKKQTAKQDQADATSATDVVEAAEQAIKPTIDRVGDFVREQPFQAVGLALGVGYLGRILFRGPFVTLAMLGGVGYLGARLAAK